MTAAPSAVVSVEARLFRVPLAEALEDAMHGVHTHFELVTVAVRRGDGAEGVGYTYTGGLGGRAILAVIETDLAPWLIGRDAGDVEALNDAMQRRLHYVGRGGLAGFAISAVDVALWDLRGRVEGLPLWRMAGGAEREARAYRGGIDLAYPLDRLLESVQGHLDAGYEAVKIKIGRPTLAEDVARARAVRELLGPGRPFMIDANYAFDAPRAIETARAMADLDLTWFEEPLDPDDLAGYAAVAELGGAPLAMGENLHIEAEFARALDMARLAYLQPDASNCGGVTGWLRAARLAARHGVPVCSHGAQELHVSLVAAQPNAGWVEAHSFPIDRYTRRPFRVTRSMAEAPDEPGVGVAFDWTLLAPHRSA